MDDEVPLLQTEDRCQISAAAWIWDHGVDWGVQRRPAIGDRVHRRDDQSPTRADPDRDRDGDYDPSTERGRERGSGTEGMIKK